MPMPPPMRPAHHSAPVCTTLYNSPPLAAYVGGYRVTSKEALRAAVEAAGQVRIQCEQFLSKVGRAGLKPLSSLRGSGAGQHK